MIIALIKSGNVENLAEFHDLSAAQAMQEAMDIDTVVLTSGLPVQIGDEYHDGKFWRDGEEVRFPEPSTEPPLPELPSVQERLDALHEAVETLQIEVDEADYALDLIIGEVE